jgi:hypothetical protein
VSLKRIRLELARSKDFPNGNPNHGYEFMAPLKDDGHIDEDGFKAQAQLCTVTRFAEHEDDQHGQLIRTRGGRWSFSYEPGDDDDEPIFRLAAHPFNAGEYISITEHDGQERVFRVVSVSAPHFPQG